MYPIYLLLPFSIPISVFFYLSLCRTILILISFQVLEEFHSHLEPLHLISNLHDQISFSYAAQPANLVPVAKSVFSTAEDPSRFLSIHCELFPATAWCSR